MSNKKLLVTESGSNCVSFVVVDAHSKVSPGGIFMGEEPMGLKFGLRPHSGQNWAPDILSHCLYLHDLQYKD